MLCAMSVLRIDGTVVTAIWQAGVVNTTFGDYQIAYYYTSETHKGIEQEALSPSCSHSNNNAPFSLPIPCPKPITVVHPAQNHHTGHRKVFYA